MEKQTHPLCELFKQLGLPAATEEIEHFCVAHTPLAAEIKLADASFWTPVQANFLREAVDQDADWAPIVDQLDANLRTVKSGMVPPVKVSEGKGL